jgi:hypothetical protein
MSEDREYLGLIACVVTFGQGRKPYVAPAESVLRLGALLLT